MVLRKNLRSLERRWEKISKFLGDLPSEQIFYRNIPLGALGRSSEKKHTRSTNNQDFTMKALSKQNTEA